MPYICIDGAQVHYTDTRANESGRAETAQGAYSERCVLFVHGGFGSTSELWAGAMAALPGGWRGIAIDNFLRSAPPQGGYSVSAFVRRLGAFVEALELVQPVIVGHSMGGVMCQLLAAEQPAGISGMVLVCTGAHMSDHALGKRLLAQLREGGPAALRDISAQWFHRVPADFFDAYVERAMQVPVAAMAAVQDSLINIDTRPLLPRIHAPTLVVWGRHDTGRTREHAMTLLAGIPHAEFAEMSDSGHSPMVETPDAFNHALTCFLTRISAGSSAEPALSSTTIGAQS